MARPWIHELRRDLIALAGWPFFALVVVRLLVGVDPLAALQLVVGVGLMWLAMRFTSVESRAAMVVLLLVIVTDHYQSIGFGFFAGVVVIGVVWSLFLERSAAKVRHGLAVGVLATIVSYLLVTKERFGPLVTWLDSFFQPVVQFFEELPRLF